MCQIFGRVSELILSPQRSNLLSERVSRKAQRWEIQIESTQKLVYRV